MKFLKTLLTLVIIHTIFSTAFVNASSISPAIRRVKLPQGQRQYATVAFKNTEDMDMEVMVTPYSYNPKTDEISTDSKKFFLKADTDTFQVKANSSVNIRYEIIPIANMPNGTYFNILALTPLIENQDIQINHSISQLVILDIVSADDEVKGITTTQYLTNITVVNRGIPFLTPLKLKYTITNNSNYVLTPQGRIDIFNESNKYKPTYVYINAQEQHLYPNEVLEDDIQVSNWHISDLFSQRVVLGQIYNGLDSNPQNIEVEINGYGIEIMAIVVIIAISILLIKSLKQDKLKRKNVKETPSKTPVKKKKEIPLQKQKPAKKQKPIKKSNPKKKNKGKKNQKPQRRYKPNTKRKSV